MADSRDNPKYQAAKNGSAKANEVREAAQEAASSGRRNQDAAMAKLVKAAGSKKKAEDALKDLGGPGRSLLRRLTGR